MIDRSSFDSVDFLAAGARLTVGGLLAIAGAAKLAERERFADILRRFPITGTLVRGKSSASRAATGLAALEVLSGLAFMLGWRTWLVAPVIIGLLLAFSTGIVLVLARRQDISCGCFGSISAGSVKWTGLARNGAMLGVILLGMVSTRLSMDGVARGETPGSVFAVSLMIGSQIGALAMMLLTLARLRSVPAYVRRVPPPAAGTSEVWTGTRETTWRHRRAVL